MKKIDVLLVIENGIFSAGLDHELSNETMQVSGKFQTLDIFFQEYTDGQARPDVIVWDGGDTSRESVKSLRMLTRDKTSAVLLLAQHHSPEYMKTAQEIGARGILTRDTQPEALRLALLLLALGESVFPDPNLNDSGRPLNTRDMLNSLTRRETEILMLLTKGRTTQEIIAETGVKAGTLKVQLRHLYQKIGARNRTQAGAIGAQLGFAN